MRRSCVLVAPLAAPAQPSCNVCGTVGTRGTVHNLFLFLPSNGPDVEVWAVVWDAPSKEPCMAVVACIRGIVGLLVW